MNGFDEVKATVAAVREMAAAGEGAPPTLRGE
jgi:hypothetical protein